MDFAAWTSSLSRSACGSLYVGLKRNRGCAGVVAVLQQFHGAGSALGGDGDLWNVPVMPVTWQSDWVRRWQKSSSVTS